MPPTDREYAAYTGLFAAAAKGDVATISALAKDKSALNARDPYRWTPLMVAAYARQHEAAKTLIEAGADLDALERDRYDAVTIASVADDVEMLRIALTAGAHLGHVEVVKTLIAAGAPLDHVNNLAYSKPARP